MCVCTHDSNEGVSRLSPCFRDESSEDGGKANGRMSVRTAASAACAWL